MRSFIVLQPLEIYCESPLSGLFGLTEGKVHCVRSSDSPKAERSILVVKDI